MTVSITVSQLCCKIINFCASLACVVQEQDTKFLHFKNVCSVEIQILFQQEACFLCLAFVNSAWSCTFYTIYENGRSQMQILGNRTTETKDQEPDVREESSSLMSNVKSFRPKLLTFRLKRDLFLLSHETRSQGNGSL